MKPEQSERILVEELIKKTINKKILQDEMVENIEKLTGDASTRKYYRVFTTKGSYVACLDNPSDSEENEPSFLKMQKVLESEGVRVPRIFDKELTAGYILEEDLGDGTFLKKLSQIESKKEEYDLYKAAIDLIIKMHKVDTAKYIGQDFTKLSFDTEKLYSEMEFAKKYFLKSYLGIDTSSPTVEAVYKELYEICFKLSSQPKVLVHRDYHSRNIMIKDEEQIVIDFQDARMGTPLYDLVSLLEDCYYEIDANNKSKLKDYYFTEFYSKNISGKREDFESIYSMMLIQRVYKAIGSFAYIYSERKDTRYLKYIGYAFEKVRQELFKNPEFSRLRKLLSGIYYAN